MARAKNLLAKELHKLGLDKEHLDKVGAAPNIDKITKLVSNNVNVEEALSLERLGISMAALPLELSSRVAVALDTQKEMNNDCKSELAALSIDDIKKKLVPLNALVSPAQDAVGLEKYFTDAVAAINENKQAILTLPYALDTIAMFVLKLVIKKNGLLNVADFINVLLYIKKNLLNLYLKIFKLVKSEKEKLARNSKKRDLITLLLDSSIPLGEFSFYFYFIIFFFFYYYIFFFIFILLYLFLTVFIFILLCLGYWKE